MLRSQERTRETTEDVEGANVEAHEERSKTRMEMRGALPAVGAADQAAERPSASEMAFGGNWLTDAASDLLGGDDSKDAAPLPDTRNFLGGLFGGDDKKGPAPLITSETLFTASAPNTRKTIGVGELVDLSSNVAGKWTANGQPLLGSSLSFFKAPSRAGKVTIGFEATDGQKTSMELSVIEPSKINYKKLHDSNELNYGEAGAGMVLGMDLDPDNVSFASVGVKEVPHPAGKLSGYFVQPGKQAFNANHYPSPGYTPVGMNNVLMSKDHAFMENMPAPWMPGEVVWDVPHNFLVHGDSEGSDKRFATVKQVLRVLDDKGTCQVEKDGQLSKQRPVNPKDEG